MNNFRRHVILTILIFLIITGCEKTPSTFSADSVQPSQGKVSAHVFSGGNPVSNALVNATDPNGNIYSTITDSTGVALFNPTPFSDGSWTFILPNQAHRCIEQNISAKITESNSASQSITFQYGVSVNLNLTNFRILGFEGPIPILAYDVTLATQNDCGNSWNLSFDFTFPSVSNWYFYYPGGNSGEQNSGATCCTYNNATSGTVFTIAYVTNSNTPSYQVNVTSPIYGESQNFQGGIGDLNFIF
jgi:hypothetical protein